MISVALALRASNNGGSSSLDKEMKKETKEKGVIERILHWRTPKMINSILCIVCGSKIITPSNCTKKEKHTGSNPWTL